MLERLEGLDEVEQTACLIAERALGAVATAYEVAGRQGAVWPPSPNRHLRWMG
jgi:hypothetical protein